MKCKLEATVLKSLIKSMGALQSLGVNTKEEDIRCCFTVRGEKLYVEGANMGAYIRRQVPVTVMREGSCGVNLKTLAKSRFSGDVVLDYNQDSRKLRIVCSRIKFDLPADQTAMDVIASARPEKNRVPILATVPSSLIIDGTATVAIKPGLKEEDLRLQFSFTKTEQGGRLEIVGLDHFSFARYVKEGPTVQVKEDLHFALQSSSPSIVMKEISAPTVGIGVELSQVSGADASVSLVRFASDDAEIYYPALEVDQLDAQAQAAEIRTGHLDGSFVAYRRQLRDAVNIIKPVQDSATSGVVLIRIAAKTVEVAARSTAGMSASTLLDTEAIQMTDPSPPILQVSEKYFFELLTLAPDVVPLRVDSWDKRFLSVTALKIDDGLIEFFMSQLDLAEQQPEKEKKKSKKKAD